MSSNGGGVLSDKDKNIAVSSNFDVGQLNKAVQDVNLDAGWEVIVKKNKNKAGTVELPKHCASQTPKPNPWVQPLQNKSLNNVWASQMGGRTGRGGARVKPMLTHSGSNNNPTNAIPPPLQSGWNWSSRPARKLENDPVPSPHPCGMDESFKDNDETEDELDLSDDEILSDEYDSDDMPKSHEEMKKNKWYAAFFATLDTLTPEQINEPTRQWHCPACLNGPGAIDWYNGLQSLLTHAKTKGTKRVKIHRTLAVILEEELRRIGTTVLPIKTESYGQWKGLTAVKDKEIVWPPMVVIMNTHLQQDENGKWIGMGNQELLDYFGSYEAARARHAYGPRGHRGMSLLIFESSGIGYTEAERLCKHFEDQGTDRAAWDHHPILFYPGGKRQLYGYMATKQDMDLFNQHSHGKSKLKFEIVSYQEKVVAQLKQMNEDNQQLIYYKNKVVKEQRHSKALEESFGVVSQRLGKTEQENRMVRERTKRFHEENKEEMDYQEQFFKDQLKVIIEARNAKEGEFDKLQQEERMRVEQAYSEVDPEMSDEKYDQMKQFEEEREKLMKVHEKTMAEMKSKHWKEEIGLEERFNTRLSQLMERYTPKA
uniref:protein SUPPRESSOR OF GENE SILENCING 3-like n=1 Tax=Erigeron canadensis TaxID=72917 RepID=UPI001CB92A49|nr:protein SUPPRESSOR OF GENE SILENCING 3-like [Erigeron canadensis]